MSLGLWRLLRTKSLSPGGPKSSNVSLEALPNLVFPALEQVYSLSDFVLLASMLCKLMHTLSTLCTGLHPCESSKSRQMMPLL